MSGQDSKSSIIEGLQEEVTIERDVSQSENSAANSSTSVLTSNEDSSAVLTSNEDASKAVLTSNEDSSSAVLTSNEDSSSAVLTSNEDASKSEKVVSTIPIIVVTNEAVQDINIKRANPIAALDVEGAEGGTIEGATVTVNGSHNGHFYTDMTHPTGVFRHCPVSFHEVTMPAVPYGAAALRPNDSPERPLIPSPHKSPTAPRAETRSWWCPIPRSFLCRMLFSTRASNLHFEQLLDDENVPLTESVQPDPPAILPSPTVFEEISLDLQKSDRPGVPFVVSKCVGEIEKWCNKHKKESLNVYLISGTSISINNVKNAFNTGTYGKTPPPGDIHAISGALKKYLVEIANPIIPFEFYDRFIRAAIRMEETTSLDNPQISVMKIVATLPECHRKTLRVIMTHLVRLCKWQYKSYVKRCRRLGPDERERDLHKLCVEFSKFVTLFSVILIRPPWEKLRDISHRIYEQNAVLLEMFQIGEWGEAMPPLEAIISTYPRVKFEEGFGSLESTESRVLDAEWYWGDVSLSRVNELLKDVPEGSFLVWNSLTVPGTYNLTLKMTATIEHLKILFENGHYGFVQPTTFTSVATLVSWHRVNSLRKYNRNLTSRLLFPIKTTDIVPKYPSGETHQELWNFMIINRRLVKKIEQHEYLTKWRSWFFYDLMVKRPISFLLLELQGKMTEMNQRLFSLDSGIKQQIFHQRLGLFETRVGQINDIQSAHSLKMEQMKANLQMVTAELTSLKQEMNKYTNYKKTWKDWLLSKGKTEMFLEDVSHRSLHDETAMTISLRDDTTWMVICDESEAEFKLGNRSSGTFMIRPLLTPQQNNLVLSIMYEDQIYHCNVKYGNCNLENCNNITHGRCGYGFEDACPRLTTLVDFVLHYRLNTLADSNNGLTTTLQFPQFWHV